MSSNSGKIFIVATPLGNPGDLSPRAREVLSQVDCVLAEDTRRTGLLMERCGISVTSFTSFHDHNESEKLGLVLGWLKEGKKLALVSDAGTPLLSDPGYRLVRACREAGFAVSPIPGPSAVVTALSACGLPPLPYAFLGFLPRKESDITRLFTAYCGLSITLVFFERKDRLRSSLQLAYNVLGDRECVIARELTKQFEEFIPLTLASVDAVTENLLGEITVVIGPQASVVKTAEAAVTAMLAERMKDGGKPKDVAKSVQAEVTGWTAKEVYALLQSIS